MRAVIRFTYGDDKTFACINTSQEMAQAFAATITLEKARAGDMSEITERLRQNMLTDRERKWLVEYLEGKVKEKACLSSRGPCCAGDSWLA
jgi:hypothetical protein